MLYIVFDFTKDISTFTLFACLTKIVDNKRSMSQREANSRF